MTKKEKKSMITRNKSKMCARHFKGKEYIKA